MFEYIFVSFEIFVDSYEKCDFICQIVCEDLVSGKYQVIKICFLLELNGYLYIGYVKLICLNFGIVGEFSGVCNLCFDDINLVKEDLEYVVVIQDDVCWLGFSWNELCYVLDYFQVYYLVVEKLIEQGKVYVCDLLVEEVCVYRGILIELGCLLLWCDCSIEENFDLFCCMCVGEFFDGVCILCVKIDMVSGNINLCDLVLYCIKYVEYQNIGNVWLIYLMYDFVYVLGDLIEGIIYLLCMLEFEDY